MTSCQICHDQLFFFSGKNSSDKNFKICPECLKNNPEKILNELIINVNLFVNEAIYFRGKIQKIKTDIKNLQLDYFFQNLFIECGNIFKIIDSLQNTSKKNISIYEKIDIIQYYINEINERSYSLTNYIIYTSKIMEKELSFFFGKMIKLNIST